MRTTALLAVLFSAAIAITAQSSAADLQVVVLDKDSQPVEGAVVALSLSAKASPQSAPSKPRIVSQKQEAFDPIVTVLKRGEQIIFRNDDAVRHHVYSFSDAKKFDVVDEPGQQSDPITFGKDGVVVIGCNIHDHMIAYAYVTSAPLTARTNASGKAVFANVDTNGATVAVWHPRLKNPEEFVNQPVNATAGTLSFAVGLLPERKHSKRHRSY